MQNQRLCLGCGEVVAPEKAAHCHGFSVLEHPELAELSIAHVDCDAFFASVEKRDRPELAHQPVIVGGRQRGVVAAACYVARSYGVRSAMPSFQAQKLCPSAVFVKPRFEAYREASLLIRQAMEAITPLVQPVSIDEAFLDLSGTERLHGQSSAATLIKLQRQIENDVGVTVSVGLSHNKSLAKMASELRKPRGFGVIGKEETLRFLAPRHVSDIHGVGPSLVAKLKKHRIETIGDLQALGMKALCDQLGETGYWLHQRAHGIDARSVATKRETKSVSGETTFAEDLRRFEKLEDHLYKMAQKVSKRAKEKSLAGLVVTLKLKTKGFRSLTRRRTLGVATNLSTVIFEESRDLLKEELQKSGGETYRLIGVGISDLVSDEAMHLDLAYPQEHEKIKNQEEAIDHLRARFGEGVIGTMRDRRTSKS